MGSTQTPMDWQEQKKQTLLSARRIVFKVGSAVITRGDGVAEDVVDDLARQMAAVARMPEAEGRSIVLVTSGAVAAGRSVLKRWNIGADTQGLSGRQAAAAIGQGVVMHTWAAAFERHGMAAAQVLLTAEDFRARERFLNVTNTFAELLSWGIVPVVNENDTVSTAEIKFGDNDSLGNLLSALVGADLYVNITSAPGVYGSDPTADPKAAILPCIEDVFALNLEQMCGGKTTVGTGGMYSKLLAARRAAQNGVPTYIISGRQKGAIEQAFALGAESVGTWVSPLRHAIPSRKFWMAYKSQPAGSLEIDAGAAKALEERGASLLPGGIIDVEGSFQKGALVRITYQGRSLGVGLTNYSSATLKRIRGLKRIEVAVILGDAHYPEVIHRDNLLLDAAV